MLLLQPLPDQDIGVFKGKIKVLHPRVHLITLRREQDLLIARIEETVSNLPK